MTIDARGCRDLERALSLERLESNGRGGYASGTVAGANTRRYHALLLVARHPPVDRVTLVNHLEESIEVGGETYPLSTNLYAGAVHPEGYHYCEQFSDAPWPTWQFACRGIRLERELVCPHGRDLVILRWLTPANFYYWLADEGIRIGPGFYRGYGAGLETGAGVSFFDHDRVWRLQRLLEAIRLMEADPAVTAVNLADAYEPIAELIGGFRYEFHRSLQGLTDLNQIPPPIEFDQDPWSVSRENLKLNDQGQIVGLQFPVSWEEARTDAERWCWALEQAVKFDPPRLSRLELLRASYVDSIVGISATFPARADESGGVAPAFEAPAFVKMC